ncbi:MAG: hypothetical protein J3R72DRAFT_75590, partial [Linnemannia gamsii]
FSSFHTFSPSPHVPLTTNPLLRQQQNLTYSRRPIHMIRLTSPSAHTAGRRLLSSLPGWTQLTAAGGTTQKQLYQRINFHTAQRFMTAPSNQEENLTESTEPFKRPVNISPPSTSSANAPPNNLPRCAGKTAKNKPCQRDGVRTVDPNSNKSYCYQHDPTHTATRRCLGIVRDGSRQCYVTCSDSEIRSDGRPICNYHYRGGTRYVSR